MVCQPQATSCATSAQKGHLVLESWTAVQAIIAPQMSWGAENSVSGRLKGGAS